MEEAVLPPNTDPESDRIYRHIWDKAQGTIVELGSAPSTSDDPPLLRSGEFGFYDGKVYWNIAGTTYQFNVTAVG